MSRTALIVALALLAAACGTEPSDAVTATTDKSIYSTDQPIQVTLTNTSSKSVIYEACPERWDHKTSIGYTRFEELEMCPQTIVATTVPAHGSAEVTYTFPSEQALGIWRIPIPVRFAGSTESSEVHTADFDMAVSAGSRAGQ
jgi:hypothetical protein